MAKSIFKIAIWLPPIFINISSLTGNEKLLTTGLYAVIILISALIRRSLKCQICGKKRLASIKIKSLLKLIFWRFPTCTPDSHQNRVTTTQQEKCLSYAIMEKNRLNMQLSLITFLSYLVIYDNYFSECGSAVIFSIVNILILFPFYHGIITTRCPNCHRSLFWDKFDWKTQYILLGFILLIPHVKCPYCHENIFKNG